MTENTPQDLNEKTESHTIPEAVSSILKPVSKLVWGYDQISDALETKVAEVLANVQEERIIKPALNVVGPAVEAFKFSDDNEVLQDFLSRLIAKAIDSKTAIFALPYYVDIIKNLVPDEGLILRLFTTQQQFPMIDVKLKLKQTGGYNTLHKNVSTISVLAKCNDLRLTTEYLDHLCRLGLFEVPENQAINTANAYDELINLPGIEAIKKQFEGNDNFDVEISKKMVRLTGLGSEFIKTCVLDKKAKRNIA